MQVDNRGTLEPVEQTLRFASTDGHSLVGRLHMPTRSNDAPQQAGQDAVRPIAYALFAHCFTCSKDLAAATRITQGLARQGFAVLRFDFTGIGESDGDFSDTHFSSNVDDLIAAAAFMRRSFEAPQLLVGHSLGGSAALVAANHIPECRAVATIGAPFAPDHVTHLLGGALETIQAQGEATVNIADRSFTVRRKFLNDLKAQDPKSTLATLQSALLVMHAPQDDIVGIDNARLIFEAARHPKSFLSLDGANHLLTRPADAAYVADVLAAWAERYLRDQPARARNEETQTAAPAAGAGQAAHKPDTRKEAATPLRTTSHEEPAKATARSDKDDERAGETLDHADETTRRPTETQQTEMKKGDKELPDGVLLATHEGPGFYVSLDTASHSFGCDEPTNLGGSNQAPTPYDLLLGSLGACTAMTVAMYARRKKWPLEGVRVTLDHARVHKDDCQDCEAKDAKVEVIRRTIGLHGPLDETQHARLMDIADRCPVHKTLSGTLRIETKEA